VTGADRYVTLGLAPARAAWFRDVAQWATSGAVPVEFVKCVSIEEARARLASGRPFSALLVDGASPGFDRDLIDVAVAAGCVVLVVEDARVERAWHGLGAAAVLPAAFSRDELVAALGAHARLIERTDAATSTPDRGEPAGARWRGRLVAVTGAGGTGTSVVALATAQGLSEDARNAGNVLLADFALDAHQALLHDTGDVVPGVQELVEAHRRGQPRAYDVRALTFDLPGRHYDLLLGLRRHRDWVVLRPRAFDAALDSLRRGYRIVVADIDADFEGEDDSGSIDVEERNLLARATAQAADVVVAVGAPGLTGLAAFVSVIGALLDHGVAARRILPVVNRAPRSQRARARLTRAVADLLGPDARRTLPSPVFVAERRRLDDALRAGAPLPAGFADPVASAVHAVLERAPARYAGTAEPTRVRPGSLGSWSEDAG
jgi:hypothetical protein